MTERESRKACLYWRNQDSKCCKNDFREGLVTKGGVIEFVFDIKLLDANLINSKQEIAFLRYI